MSDDSIAVEFLIPGHAAGRLLQIEDPVSFWGGVDLTSGELMEVDHPERGTSLGGAMLVGGRTKGSTAGPGALLELMCQGCGPAGFLTFDPDLVLLSATKAMKLLDLQPAPVAVVPAAYQHRVVGWCQEYRGGRLILDADSGTASVLGR